MSVKNYFRLIAEGQEMGSGGRFWKPVLKGASFFYGAGVRTLQALYAQGVLPRKRLPFPVISVGNLTWGGTGKTPLVEYLARRVIERGKTPLILTRGYGQDEVEQFRQHLPAARIGIGKERYRVARGMSRKERIHVAILDDGFQHWKIQRDIEILTINALNPFGNGLLVPAGILREPLEALRRASVIVLSHVNLVGPKEVETLRSQIRRYAPSAFIIQSYLEPLFFYRARQRARVTIDRLGRRRVATFSALANPRSFQQLLIRQGIRPVRNFEFCDHHTFTSQELEEVKRVSVNGEVDEIVTTEKDFYRSAKAITEILNPLVLATRIRIVAGEEILNDRIFRLLGVN